MSQSNPRLQRRSITKIATATTVVGLLAAAASIAGPPKHEPIGSVKVIESRANTYTSNHQSDPAVDFDADGRSLVVWGSRRQDGGSWGVFGQRIDPLGRRIGSEIRINQTAMATQWRPDVAYDGNGGFWVTWESFGQDGADGSIVARRFAADFQSATDEIIVNQNQVGHQNETSIATDVQGRALICWASNDGQIARLRGRIYDSAGEALTNEFPITGKADGQAGNVSAAALQGTDAFMITWARADSAGIPTAVVARKFGIDGKPRAKELIVAQHSQNDSRPIEPAIDSDADGRFVITWMSRSGNGHAVRAARFDSRGNVIDAAWTVAQTLPDSAGWNAGASVAMASDGRFIIGHSQYDAGMPVSKTGGPLLVKRMRPSATVYAQRFDAAAQPAGEMFKVNKYDPGQQALAGDRASRRMAWSDLDQLAFAWAGDTDPGEHIGVGLTLHVPEGLDAPAPEATLQIAAAQDIEVQQPLAPPEKNLEGPGEPDFSSRGSGPDFGFEGFPATEWIPPDPDLAVGPNHIVAVVNMKIRFFTKEGVLTHEQDLRTSSGFFGPVGGGTFMFDPIAYFDPHSQRFVVGCAEIQSRDSLYVAISDDADPNGSWNMFRHSTSSSGGFPDFPNMGVGPDAIYFANDFFSAPVGNFVTIINKQDLIDGNTPQVNLVRMANGQISLGAVKNLDTDAPAQYFATSYSGSDQTIQLEAISDPLGTPARTTFQLPVPRYGQPSNAPQAGSSTRFWTIDWRIKNGVYRNGKLYLAHGVTPTGFNRTLVRWYEIDMNGWPASGQNPVLADTGNLDLGAGIYTWFPDIYVDSMGNAGLVYSRSSTSEFVSFGRAIRRVGDPAGQFKAATILKAATSPDPGGRWGDYQAVDEDPACPGRIWGHGEYRTDVWRTWIGSFYAYNSADFNEDGAINTLDFLAFLAAYSAGDPSADYNGDGVINTLDFLAYLNDYSNPCG